MAKRPRNTLKRVPIVREPTIEVFFRDQDQVTKEKMDEDEFFRLIGKRMMSEQPKLYSIMVDALHSLSYYSDERRTAERAVYSLYDLICREVNVEALEHPDAYVKLTGSASEGMLHRKIEGDLVGEFYSFPPGQLLGKYFQGDVPQDSSPYFGSS